jgi:hypothetical protein
MQTPLSTAITVERVPDATLNRRHQRALSTVTRFLGGSIFDTTEFSCGYLVCGWLPF